LAIAAKRAERSARNAVTAVEKLAMSEAVKAAKEASREEAERRRLTAEEDRLLAEKAVEEKRLWREKQARVKDNDKKRRENERQEKLVLLAQVMSETMKKELEEDHAHPERFDHAQPQLQEPTSWHCCPFEAESGHVVREDDRCLRNQRTVPAISGARYPPPKGMRSPLFPFAPVFRINPNQELEEDHARHERHDRAHPTTHKPTSWRCSRFDAASGLVVCGDYRCQCSRPKFLAVSGTRSPLSNLTPRSPLVTIVLATCVGS
jgi:hypothetical protein